DQREHVRESEGGHCREYDQDGWWRKLRPGMRKARRTSQHPHGGRAEKGEDERCEDAAARERVERREEERERDDFCEADGKGGDGQFGARRDSEREREEQPGRR